MGWWWYLLGEAFKQFAPYFHLVMAVHPFLHVMPLAARLGPRTTPVVSEHEPPCA
jgi:hypothetical protein